MTCGYPEMAFEIKTQQQLIALAIGIARAQIAVSIRPEAAIRFGLINALLIAAGLPAPILISGFRTLQQQANLRNVRGADGQLLKPARRSWHTVGLAFDLDKSSPTLPLFAALWRLLGGRVGADFDSPDPGHFDFPLSGITPSAAF